MFGLRVRLMSAPPVCHLESNLAIDWKLMRFGVVNSIGNLAKVGGEIRPQPILFEL